MPEIVPLESSRRGEAIALLAGSFESDPLLPYLTRREGASHRRLVRRILALELDFHVCSGAEVLSIVLNGRLAAVSLIEPPGCHPRLLRLAPVVARFVLAAPPACVARAARYSAAIGANRPAWPHYRREATVVDPALRGQGLGRLLHDQLRVRCLNDPSADGIAFMTANPVNIRLYRHLGYDMIEPRVPFPELPLYYFEWRKAV